MAFGHTTQDYDGMVGSHQSSDNGDSCSSSGQDSLYGDDNGQDVVYGGLGMCSNRQFGYAADIGSLVQDVVVNGVPQHVLNGTIQIPCSGQGETGSVTLTFDLTFHAAATATARSVAQVSDGVGRVRGGWTSPAS